MLQIQKLYRSHLQSSMRASTLQLQYGMVVVGESSVAFEKKIAD